MGNLVLTRKPGESIQIKDNNTGEEITLTVVRVEKGHARLSLNAPNSYNIVRTELLTQTQRS